MGDVGFEVLGSIPVDSSELLASALLSEMDETSNLIPITPGRIQPQIDLPVLGPTQSGELTQPSLPQP